MKLERAVVEIAGGCNYKCDMCPQSTGRGKDFTKKMCLPHFESILDQLVSEHGSPQVNLEGSGEPTINSDLPLYVEACTKRGLKSFMYTNGARLRGDLMKDTVDAGISFIRFSCIGYNRETYRKWMSKDNFVLLIDNAIKTQQYIKKTNSKCDVSSYHLILDNSQIEYEVEQYRTNFIDRVGSLAYIWKMHNWSGNIQPIYLRDPSERKTCGRPFAPEITIRAGGLNGKYGAVTPCCQTMGPPHEAESVLGHTSEYTISEILNGNAYEKLREAHRQEDFDSVSYCKSCDFLYDDPEVLVWSNDSTARTNHMLGTNFNLEDYK
jgi:MoaA/NifB/PqqE/SkfB family radical SAM enzyme